tara:strand:+ start:205 stop:549 length:345 start_codon:yes stop_codon:yes gene_type:complete
MSSTAQILTQIFEKRDITKTELARRTSHTYPQVWRWLSGRRPPALATIDRLAVALDATEQERDAIIASRQHIPIELREALANRHHVTFPLLRELLKLDDAQLNKMLERLLNRRT